MFRRPSMKIEDYTCMLCGSRLGLKFSNAVIGDNPGNCPMCNEPFRINITKSEMEEFMEAEEERLLINQVP